MMTLKEWKRTRRRMIALDLWLRRAYDKNCDCASRGTVGRIAHHWACGTNR